MEKITIISSTEVKNGYKLILDENSTHIFYPDGKGGQLGDRGLINNAEIISVSSDGNPIVKSKIKPGQYSYSIDMERRDDIACQHTAEHLIAGIAHSEFGFKNAGFRMSEEYSTIDLDGENLSDEKVYLIEKIANDKIKNSLAVSDYTVCYDEAQNISGLRKEISDKVKGDIRVVKIEGTDLCACGGFHVDNLSQLQILKITNTERVKGKYLRLYFISGKRALEDYSLKNEISKDICKLLSCQNDEIVHRIKSLNENISSLKTDLRTMAMEYSKLLVPNLEKEAIDFKNLNLIFYADKNGEGEFLHKFIDLENFTLLLEKNGVFSIFSKQISCRNFINNLRTTYEVKGGGSDSNGNIKGNISVSQLIDCLKNF